MENWKADIHCRCYVCALWLNWKHGFLNSSKKKSNSELTSCQRIKIENQFIAFCGHHTHTHTHNKHDVRDVTVNKC